MLRPIASQKVREGRCETKMKKERVEKERDHLSQPRKREDRGERE